MTDWTEEQILDEIIALTEFAENEYRGGDDPMAQVSRRLGRLYQEVGKKLL